MHWIPWALTFALARAGSSKPARMAIMAMTTRSSMSVKPCAVNGRAGTNGLMQFRRRIVANGISPKLIAEQAGRSNGQNGFPKPLVASLRHHTGDHTTWSAGLRPGDYGAALRARRTGGRRSGGGSNMGL